MLRCAGNERYLPLSSLNMPFASSVDTSAPGIVSPGVNAQVQVPLVVAPESPVHVVVRTPPRSGC